jgi:hypothetical protein
MVGLDMYQLRGLGVPLKKMRVQIIERLQRVARI